MCSVSFLFFSDEAAKQLYGFGAELVSEIGFLTDLEALIVPGFHFVTTSIPTEIGRLTNLIDLNLGTFLLSRDPCGFCKQVSITFWPPINPCPFIVFVYNLPQMLMI